MLTAKDFRTRQVQLVITTPEHEYAGFSPAKAVAAVLSKFQDRFDGEMQVLPIPAGMPAEIDRVILKSSDNERVLAMAPARIILTVARRSGPNMDLAPTASSCVEVLKHYAAATGASFGRLAMVVIRTTPTRNPSEELIQRFCNTESRDGAFRRSESFEIHNHKSYRPICERIDYSVNSWVRCKTAMLDEDKKPIVLVEQDINTLAKDVESRKFSQSQMDDFFGMAVREADSILIKYFP